MFSSLLFAALSFTAAPSIADPPAAEAAGLVHATYSLGAVLPPAEPERVSMSPMPFDPRVDSGGAAVPILDARRVGAEEVVDLVRRAIDPAEWESPGRMLTLVSGNGAASLSVTAPQEVQTEVARLLQFLASHLRREIRVRFEVFSVTARDPAFGGLAQLDDPRAAIASLVESGVLERRTSTTLALLAGVPQVTSRTREQSFVSDFDVEIAQAAAINDPIVETYSVGAVVAARAEVIDGQQVLLRFAVRNAHDLRPLRRMNATSQVRLSIENRVSFGISEVGSIESPCVAFETLAGSARLAAGRAQVAYVAPLDTGSDDAHGMLVTMTLESIGAAEHVYRNGDRELGIRDVVSGYPNDGELESLSPHAGSVRAMNNGDAWQGLVNPIVIDAAGQADDNTAAVGTMLVAAQAGLESDSSVEIHRGFLFVLGPAGRVAEQLDRSSAQFSRAFSGATFVGTTAANEPGERRAVFAVPAAAGRAYAFNGVEQNLLLDSDVEVANNASISDPGVATILTGQFFDLTAESDSAGGESLALGGFGRRRSGSIQIADHQLSTSAPFERMDLDATRIQSVLRFAKGGANSPPARVENALPSPDGDLGSFDLEVTRIVR